MKTTRRILLVTGGEWHDFKAGAEILSTALKAANIEVAHTEDGAALGKLGSTRFDCVVLYTQGEKFGKSQVAALEKYVRNGGGLVGVHCACNTNEKDGVLPRLVGSQFKTHSPVFDFRVSVSDPNHPVVHRIQEFRITDELYVLDPKDSFQTFLTAWWDGKPQPMAYWKNDGKGRVVYLANGHSAASLSQPTWLQIFVRSVRFAAGEDWSEKTVNVGVIGYGGAFNMGKLHAESCNRARMKTVAVCDIDPKRTATARTELGAHVQTFEKVEEMLANSDAEMCIIITPHNTHAPLAVQCLKAGRHIVCEKPFTITVQEATQVIETARRVKKMATVFHNRRWDGDFMAIKNIIASGVIGEVYHIECFLGGYGEPKLDWWRSYKEISGGHIYDWGAHFCDWVLNLIPAKIVSVSGDFQKRVWHQVTNEDYTEAFIRFEGGQTASIQQSSLAAIGRSRWRILGTRGGIEQVNGDPKEPIRVVSYQNSRLTETKVPWMASDWDAFYRNVADHLILGEPLAVTPESARKVIAVLHLAEKSSKLGGKPIPMPFPQ